MVSKSNPCSAQKSLIVFNGLGIGAPITCSMIS